MQSFCARRYPFLGQFLKALTPIVLVTCVPLILIFVLCHVKKAYSDSEIQ